MIRSARIDPTNESHGRASLVTAPYWVAQMGAYDGMPRSTASGSPDPELYLDSNEGPAPSEAVRERLRQVLLRPQTVNRYPPADTPALREAIASCIGCAPSEISLFAGANGALAALCQAFLAPGDKAVLAVPTYDPFRCYVETAGAKPIMACNRDDPLGFDEARFLDHCLGAGAKIIYLVNPNNPAGYTIDLTFIDALAGACPSSLLIVDETYIEFSEKASSAVSLSRRHGNISVVRSFSKAYGLAGLRLGYTVASPATTALVRKVRDGKSVTALAVEAELAVIGDIAHYEKKIGDIVETRKWCLGVLRSQGLSVRDCDANFLLLETPSPGDLAAAFASRGIHVRNLSQRSGLESILRISIGEKHEMETMTEALRDIGQARPIPVGPSALEGRKAAENNASVA